jgi:hypothetical protein
MPPQSTSDAPAGPAPPGTVLERIAGGLRDARARTGLSEERAVRLLAQRGLEIGPDVLRGWESSGVVRLDAAVRLADAYGTTVDVLSGRRAYRGRRPAADLPPPSRSAW